MHDDDMTSKASETEFAPPGVKGYEEPIDLTAAAEEVFGSDFAKGFDLWVEKEMSDPQNQPNYWTSLPVLLGDISYEEADHLLRAFAHASTEGCKNCQAHIFQFMTDVMRTVVNEMVRRDGLMDG
jgi:hypothetical protein